MESAVGIHGRLQIFSLVKNAPNFQGDGFGSLLFRGGRTAPYPRQNKSHQDRKEKKSKRKPSHNLHPFKYERKSFPTSGCLSPSSTCAFKKPNLFPQS